MAKSWSEQRNVCVILQTERTKWYSMVWYGMAWYGMTWHSTVRYDVASQFFCFIFFLIYEQIAEKHALNLLEAINSQTLLILSIPKLD